MDIRDGVKIFWQSRPGSPAHVAWCRFLLLDVGSFSSHPLGSGQHYLLHALDATESEVMWEDECRHNAIIANDMCFWFSSITQWNLHIGAFGVNTTQYSMMFANFPIDRAQLNLVCCTVDKTWKAQIQGRFTKYKVKSDVTITLCKCPKWTRASLPALKIRLPIVNFYKVSSIELWCR